MSKPGFSRSESLALSAASPAASLGWVSERCIRTQPQHLGCDRCIESCPVNALVFIDSDTSSSAEQRLIATDACHGCSACLPSCPTEALLSPEIQSLESRLFEREAGATARIQCHRATPETGDLTMHCLRAIGPDQVMAWRSGAAGRSLSLCVAEDCDNCQAAPLTPEPDSWLEAMLDQGVLIKRGSTPFEPASGTAFSRRDFFSTRHRALPEVDADATEPRARRLQRAFHAAETGQLPETVTLPRVVLDTDRCDASGVCAKVCPTPALTLMPSGELNFSALDCISCGYCVESCPQQALSLSITDLPEDVVLRQTPVIECFDCGREFAATSADAREAAICPACRRDASLFREEFNQLFG